MSPTEPPSGNLRPTSRRTLVIAALVGIGLAWISVNALEFMGRPLPPLPLIGAATLFIAALAIGFTAHRTHRQLHTERRAIAASRGVLLVTLAKTAVVAGVALAGGYFTIALLAVPGWEARLPRERALAAVLSGLAAVCLAIAGHFLEVSCRLPEDGEDDAADAPQGLPG